MNTKDFVVLPWGKPGNSVKLKYKNAQELRREKMQLELENKELEKKLQELDSTMNKERDKRESSGYHWKSGQAGKLGNRSQMMSQNKGNVIKLSAGKVKLKLLKEQIQESIKQPLNYKMTNSSENEKPKIKGKVCGQCENKAALLVCLECGEDYCSGCFAKIHQKGALKLHRTTLLQAKSQILSSVLDVAHQFIREVNPGEPKEENNSTKEISENHSKSKSSPLQESSSEVVFTTSKKTESANQKDGLLCEGSFNEEASARSFQEVLQQWRTGNHNANEKQNLHATKPDSMEACEVQTNLKIWREPLEIQFKEDSLSYMDKLWLKKHKRNLQGQLLNMQQDKFIHSSKTTSDTQLSPNGSDEESNVEETKVQHPALFLKAEELKIERFEPALKIVELDDTYEEEFEERGNVVPYKVELADADSKQSWTFHEYQKNNFLYENDVHRHYVFAKRRTGLLNICVTNSSSYYKENSTAGISNMDFDNMADLHVYSTATEKVEEKSFCEKNLTEESIANHKSADSSTPFESKDSLPSVDLEEPSVKEKLYQGIRGSLDFSNLHERPNLQDSKTTQSPLLLQEIALRRKPITEHYQGLEKFFFSDENRRLNLLPSHSLEGSSSSTKITLAGDREWIPDHSLSAHADNAVALDVLCGAQNLSPSRKQQTVGKIVDETMEPCKTSQRPSTANLPFSNSVKKSSSCLSSSHLRPRSVTTRLLSRAASEISEIEYIDVTNHNEPFLDNIADQQTLDSLEKELNELRNLADPSEKLYSLTSEELPAFNSHLQNISDTTVDFLKTSNSRGPCGFQQQSSSGKDTEIPFWLTPSESTTDEDEEDFMDKQHVITLPWSNNI